MVTVWINYCVQLQLRHHEASSRVDDQRYRGSETSTGQISEGVCSARSFGGSSHVITLRERHDSVPLYLFDMMLSVWRFPHNAGCSYKIASLGDRGRRLDISTL